MPRLKGRSRKGNHGKVVLPLKDYPSFGQPGEGDSPQQKTAPGRAVSNSSVDGRLLPILLYPRRPQSGQAVLVQRSLPAQIFFCRQRITFTRFFQRQQAPAHCCHHFGLAPDDPAMAAWWWQICNCQGTTIRPDDIINAGTQLYIHYANSLTHTGHTNKCLTAQLQTPYAPALNFELNADEQIANLPLEVVHSGTDRWNFSTFYRGELLSPGFPPI